MTIESSLNVVDSIFTNASRSEIIDQITDILSQKSLDNLEAKKLEVAQNFFSDQQITPEEEDQ